MDSPPAPPPRRSPGRDSPLARAREAIASDDPKTAEAWLKVEERWRAAAASAEPNAPLARWRKRSATDARKLAAFFAELDRIVAENERESRAELAAEGWLDPCAFDPD